MKKRFLFLIFISFFEFLNSQCIIICNTNAGINSNDNASTIGYDNMGSGFHSTFVREQYGSRVWGEMMNSDGISNLLSPLKINTTNYPSLTGTLYHVGIGSKSISDVQLVVLTSTGLFVSGKEGSVVSATITNGKSFQKITVNGKTDGLPIGVSPNDVKMMFVTTETIIITTCTGNVYVLSQFINVRGGNGLGSDTEWSQVLESTGTPLSNVIATRGNGEVAFALKSDSTIWTWGKNIYKGDGTGYFNSNIAIKMITPPAISGIKMIQATNNSGLYPSYYVLGTDKKVYALGDNNYGQLGDNSTTDRLVWVNCKNINNTVINNAAWISANEHDYYYPNLAILNTNGQINLCGNNNGDMIGRSTSNGTNYLNYPSGISASDTILYCELGGHTTAFIKKNTIRYGYVGHLINGSLGNGSTASNYFKTVDFITPPIINVCGTTCDTPLILKSEYDCVSNKATFYIKSIYGSKIKYRINNGPIDSVTIGLVDSVSVIVNNPTSTPYLTILQFTNLSNTCNLILNYTDSIELIGTGIIVNKYKTICAGDSYFFNGNNLVNAGIYYDTLVSALGCSYILRLTLSVSSAPGYSLNKIPVNCKNNYSGKVKVVITSGKSPFTYDWSNGETKDSIENLNPGTYFVKVTDSNGCFKSDSIVILSPASYTVSVTISHITCQGLDNGKAKLIPSKPGTYTYKWIGSASTKDSISNLSAGNYFYTVSDLSLCEVSGYIVILEPNPIVKLSTVDSIKCFGDKNGKIKLNYSGIMPPFNYLWNTPLTSTSSIVSNLGKGQYSVKITDSFGCINYDTFILIEPSKLMNSYTIDKTIICNKANDGIVSINTTGGSGDYVYNIGSGNQNSPRFSSLKAGSYIVTISDKNSCIDTISFNLTEPSKIEFNLSKTNASCIESNNGKAFIKNLKGGVPPYSFLWSNGSNLDSALFLSGNNFVAISVTDNIGCQVINSIYLNIDYQLKVNTKFDTISCFGGSDGKAFVFPQNGFAPYNYSWNTIPIQTSNPASSLSFGIYQVTTTDFNGCTSINSVNVAQSPKIKINFSHTLPSCYNKNDGSIQLSATGGLAPYIFSWLMTPPLISDLAINLEPKKYVVEAKDSKNCIVKDSTILPNAPRTVQIKLIEKKDIQCFGFKNGSLKVSAFGGLEPYTYKWAHIPVLNQTELFNLLPFTSYKLTVYDNKTCFDTSTFVLTEPPLLNFNFTDIKNATCFDKYDGEFRINITGGTKPYTHSFDSFKTLESTYFFQGLKPKWYTVYLKDKNLCKLTKKIELTAPEELKVRINSENDTIECCSSTKLNSKVYTNSGLLPNDIIYQWTPSHGLTCGDCPNPILNSYVSRKYPLTVYYNNSKCKAVSDIYVHVNNPPEIFIPKAYTPNGDLLNDSYQFYGNCIHSSLFSIFNRWGEKVYESNDRFKGWDGKFKGENCPIGVYTYIINVTYMNQKIVKYTGELLLIK